MKIDWSKGYKGNLKNAVEELNKTKLGVQNAKVVQEDTDALLVDQEYRLTLLELGLVE